MIAACGGEDEQQNAAAEYGNDTAGAVATESPDELEFEQMKLRPADRAGRMEQGHVAFDDQCTHNGGSLAGGAMICGMVQCPWHSSQFDSRSGEVKAGPAETPISTYLEETAEKCGSSCRPSDSDLRGA